MTDDLNETGLVTPALVLEAGADYPEEPVHHRLKRPVTYTKVDQTTGATESVTVTEVWVSEPDGEAILATDKGKSETDKSLRLIAALTGHPYVFAKKLKGWDIAALGAIAARFFPKEA